MWQSITVVLETVTYTKNQQFENTLEMRIFEGKRKWGKVLH